MIVVMVRIPVANTEEGETLANRFRNRAGMVDNQPGFMGFELLKGEDEYISVTRWADQASLDSWMTSQSHGRAHSQPPAAGGGGAGAQQGATRPAGAGGGSVMTYEVVIPG